MDATLDTIGPPQSSTFAVPNLRTYIGNLSSMTTAMAYSLYIQHNGDDRKREPINPHGLDHIIARRHLAL
jgi:hypothetical protein